MNEAHQSCFVLRDYNRFSGRDDKSLSYKSQVSGSRPVKGYLVPT